MKENIVGRLLTGGKITGDEAIWLLKELDQESNLRKISSLEHEIMNLKEDAMAADEATTSKEIKKLTKENDELRKEISQLKAKANENAHSKWRKDFEDLVERQTSIKPIKPATIPLPFNAPHNPFGSRFDVTCGDKMTGTHPVASPTYERRMNSVNSTAVDYKIARAKELVSRTRGDSRVDPYTRSVLGVDKFEERKKWHAENDPKIYDGLLEQQKKCGLDKIDDLKDLLPEEWKDSNATRPFFNSDDHGDYVVNVTPEEIQKAWKANIIVGEETQNFSVG